MSVVYDLAGRTFGRLRVLEYAGASEWRCACSCGARVRKRGIDLRRLLVRSCGKRCPRRGEGFDARICPTCVRAFAASQSNVRYCSARCMRRAYRIRKRARARAA